MKKCRLEDRLKSLAVLVVVLVFLMGGAVYASDYDSARDGSISITLKDIGSQRAGTAFAVYQVGEVKSSTNLMFTALGNFKQLGINLNDMDTAEKQMEAAKACMGVLPEVPVQEMVSGEDGKLIFSGLAQGVYLVCQKERASYGIVDPYLVCIPYTNESKTGWVYDIVSEPKGVLAYPDLKVMKVDEDGNPVVGAKLALYDEAGNKLTEWTSMEEAHVITDMIQTGKTYTLKEISAPDGYLMSEQIDFTAGKSDELIEITMTDKKKSDLYSIKIMKYVMYEGEYRSVDVSFYAALFWDKECTQRATNVLELKLSESYSGSVFENLTAGTYYLAETDEEGNVLDVTSAAALFTNEIDNEVITLTPENPTAEANIINHFRVPDGFLLDDDAVVTINKTVISGGQKHKVTDTFYFTLYGDEQKSRVIETKSVKLTDQDSGSVSFTDKAYGTYYIAESDEDGNPVGADFGYTVSISEDGVSVSGTEKNAEVEVINDLEEDTPEETDPKDQDDTKAGGKKQTSNSSTSTKTGGGAKTGDETDIILYLVIIGGAILGIFGSTRTGAPGWSDKNLFKYQGKK